MEGYDWLKPDNFGETYRTRIPLKFIVENLNWSSYNNVFIRNYRPDRSERIRKALDSGVDPLDFKPISLSFYVGDWEMDITDGVHRIQVFNERAIEEINTNLGLYWSLISHEIMPPWMEGLPSWMEEPDEKSF